MISFHDKQVLTVSRWKSSIPLRREGTWPYFEAGSTLFFLYKNKVYKNVEPQNTPIFKNFFKA